jgi:hypothetical protein
MCKPNKYNYAGIKQDTDTYDVLVKANPCDEGASGASVGFGGS